MDPLTNGPLWLLVISSLAFAAAFIAVRFGYVPARQWLGRLEQGYDRTLRRELMIDISPRQAVYITLGGVTFAALFGGLVAQSVIMALVCGAVAAVVPHLVIRHLETKRRQKLDSQLVDGLVTLASGVRAGLNLVQSMELLVEHTTGPIHQEFAQLLREYQMGVDLNQAMRSASDRIASPLYRLTFTAIEVHRQRGGDTGQSLDRIADSVREIQRPEGKLDALTAQGRTQATMMAAMPLVFLAILWLLVDREGVERLFTDAFGRLMLLGVAALIVVGFVWIRKIMTIDL